jgi:hypothetical protein
VDNPKNLRKIIKGSSFFSLNQNYKQKLSTEIERGLVYKNEILNTKVENSLWITLKPPETKRKSLLIFGDKMGTTLGIICG